MTGTAQEQPEPGRADVPSVALTTIGREWGRIGCVGFGGPPAHIALLRQLCVERRGWISAGEFEDGIAATNLLPGPASTQLAIYTAWRLRGVAGAVVGGVCFIVPGLVLILALAALFLAEATPLWVRGAAAGAGSAVAAVAVHAAWGLVPGSWKRVGTARAARARWVGYALAGGVAAATVGPWLVLLLIAAGLLEVAVRADPGDARARTWPVPLAVAAPAAGGLLSLAWVAFKVGALSYGGGFVIIPLMQADAVNHYHWMTAAQFLNAVALGQITPGPVVQTVAVVGYAAAGVGGGLLAALVAFTPSFLFVLLGGRHFDRLRADRHVQAFLTGAGPAVVGAIAGSAIPLALALTHAWQYAVLAAAGLWLLVLRRGVVSALLAAGVLGVLLAFAGLPVG
ncbi:chromate efflux transporter [Streptacidiphilus jiangxiensis]|uniref:Chromate transporter n=1 Tax=Streptacidiphilus jiangxiensis TaxID=235985 RepID=A0A1H7QSF5_STRJI|nr:chromate efflux transporter [Streptacidiphilus jiangxiensis]SEL50873.1 chromate transporter [Streptacidiphilus jiangxiensis]